MSMRIVLKNGESLPRNKRMSTMADGEVCFNDKAKDYVLKINEDVYLVLGEQKHRDYWDGTAARRNIVRELYKNESITINFS